MTGQLAFLPSFNYMKAFPFLLDPMKYLIFHMNDPTDLLCPSPAPHFKTFQMFLIFVPSVQVSAPSKAVLQLYYFFSFFSKFNSNLLAFLPTHSFARRTLLSLRCGLQISPKHQYLPDKLRCVRCYQQHSE